LVILKSPSIKLFDYFVNKGASINFIGDSFAFEEGESLEHEKKYALFDQFQTCLDFGRIKLDDLLTVDYNYDVPERKTEKDWREMLDEDGKITISKREYLYLQEQSQYLYDLVNTDKLLDHIKSLGGKTYDQLHEETEKKKERLKNETSN
jgi:hypothetical protein